MVSSLVSMFAAAVITVPAAQEHAPQDESAKMTPRKAVYAAVEDYLLALYDVEPERIERSVHPELSKVGLYAPKGAQEYKLSPMTYDQLHTLAGQWNADDHVTEDAPRGIEVLAVAPEIACAKLTAAWGIDWMNLVREDGHWKVRQILWQSPPRSEGTNEDVAALEQAGYDYVDAFYKAEPERLDRSVHPDLVKYGRYRPDGADESVAAPMNFERLRNLAATLHADQPPADDAPRVVQVLGVADCTAALRIVGHWGVDTVHAAKEDGTWKIRHVVWQSHPSGRRLPADTDATAVNALCPFSGRPVESRSLTQYAGQVVGFCNPGCADKFARQPEIYVHLLEVR